MLDLSKVTFEQLVDQLASKVRAKDAWKDTRLSTTGMMIIELCAYIPQILSYYLKRSCEELFVDTAQYWESLTHLSKMLEIYVKRPVGACGEVKLIPKSPPGSSVVIPKFTKLWCDDVEFYLADDVTVDPSDEYVVAPVRQGSRFTANFTSAGDPIHQEYKINNELASDIDLVVKVGSTNYSVVNYMLETLDSLQARVFTDVDKSLVIQFVRGFGLPIFGQEVTVDYMVVNPDFVPPVTATWTIDDERFDVDPILPFNSGSGYEDVESFRERASKFFGIGKRAVTKDDFWYIVKSIPGVEDVLVMDVKDNFAAPFKSADIYVKGSGGVLSNTLRDYIRGVLNRVGSVGIEYRLFEAPIYEVDVYATLYVPTYATFATIRSQAINIIQSMYSQARIGQWIRRNEIIASLEAMRDVRRVLLTLPSVDVILLYQVPKLRSCRVDVVGV